MENEARLLLELVRRALLGDGDKLYLKIDVSEAATLHQLARSQGVVALSYGSIDVSNAGDHLIDVLTQWQADCIAVRRRYFKIEMATSHLVEFLGNHSIKPLLIKGLTTAQFYPEHCLREFGDIDFYLPAPFYGYANKAVEEVGLKVDTSNPKHSTFVWEGFLAENHRHFFGMYRSKACCVSEDLLNSLLRLDSLGNALGAQSGTFIAVLQIQHLLLHLQWGVKVRHLADWTMLLRKMHDNIDYTLLVEHFAKWGLLMPIAAITWLCVKYLGLEKEFAGTLLQPNLWPAFVIDRHFIFRGTKGLRWRRVHAPCMADIEALAMLLLNHILNPILQKPKRGSARWKIVLFKLRLHFHNPHLYRLSSGESFMRYVLRSFCHLFYLVS